MFLQDATVGPKVNRMPRASRFYSTFCFQALAGRCRMVFVRLAMGVAVGGLVGCASDDGLASAGAAGERFGPGYPPGSAAWKAGAQAAYRTAFMAGMQDEREGFRYDDDRGALLLDLEDRGYYRQGYRKGYYHESNLRRQERRRSEGSSQRSAVSGRWSVVGGQ